MGDRRSAYATSHSGKSAMSQSDSATSTQPSERLKVFVSYARVNVGFADQLVMVLEDKGYIPILDRHDIVAGEPWEERLRKLIFSSDACVFVLTQASAASVICRWEVQEALRLGKRLVPVVPEGLGSVDAPPELAALNWIHFYADPAIPGSGFYDGVRKVDQALKVDQDPNFVIRRLVDPDVTMQFMIAYSLQRPTGTPSASTSPTPATLWPRKSRDEPVTLFSSVPSRPE
jgi:TIR domain